MTPIRFLLICASFATVAFSAAASPSPAAQAPSGPAAQYLRSHMLMAARDLHPMYELSNGGVLHVSAVAGDELRVRYGRFGDRYLQYDDAQQAFVSRSGLLKLSFDLDARGTPVNLRFEMPKAWY